MSRTAGSYEVSASPSGARGFSADLPAASCRQCRAYPSQADEPMTSRTAVAKPIESAEPTMRTAQQLAEEEGLSFAGTPGPGYSEGGDVYQPKVAPKGLL